MGQPSAQTSSRSLDSTWCEMTYSVTSRNFAPSRVSEKKTPEYWNGDGVLYVYVHAGNSVSLGCDWPVEMEASKTACSTGVIFGTANAIAAILDFKSRGRLGGVESAINQDSGIRTRPENTCTNKKF